MKLLESDPSSAAKSANRPQTATTAIMVLTLAGVFFVDQTSKNAAVERLIDGPANGPGPLWFGLVANRGALMGIPIPGWLLVVGALIVAATALTALTKSTPKRITIGWGLIIGGAAGNLFDRLQHRPRFPDHAVVDWITSKGLPTFNLADIAIVVGLALVAFAATNAPAKNE